MIPMSGHAPGQTATGKATSQTQLTQMLEKQGGLDVPSLRSSHTLSSTHSMLSMPDSASSSSVWLCVYKMLGYMHNSCLFMARLIC